MALVRLCCPVMLPVAITQGSRAGSHLPVSLPCLATSSPLSIPYIVHHVVYSCTGHGEKDWLLLVVYHDCSHKMLWSRADETEKAVPAEVATMLLAFGIRIRCATFF